jgi:hypothetical protein
MPNTVFPTFLAQYILDFSSAEHWDLPNTEIFQFKDVASVNRARMDCLSLPSKPHSDFKQFFCNYILKFFLTCGIFE